MAFSQRPPGKSSRMGAMRSSEKLDEKATPRPGWHLTWSTIYSVPALFPLIDLACRGDHTTYIAIKVLTAKATGLHLGGLLHDFEFLQAIATLDPHQAQSLPHLRDHFLTTSPHGEHLCLVLDLLGTDVHTFRLFAPSHTVKLPIVQKIAADVVDALASLHSLNIVNAGACTSRVHFIPDLTLERYQTRQHTVCFGLGREAALCHAAAGWCQLSDPSLAARTGLE
jgi:hypothetical protein